MPADVIHAQVLVLGGLDLIQGLDPDLDLDHVTVINLEGNRAQTDLRGRERLLKTELVIEIETIMAGVGEENLGHVLSIAKGDDAVPAQGGCQEVDVNLAIEAVPGVGAEAEARDSKWEDLGVEVEASRYVIWSFL